MPTYVRWREQGATYFFTVVAYRRQRILTKALPRRLLRAAIAAVRERLPFELLTTVLLPDHLHCIWTLPEDDDDFPERWRQIKGRFTHDYLAAGGRDWDVTDQHRSQGRRGVWQPRYWEHRIRNEEDYLQYRDYIHLNPVKHGYAQNPGDWPWSSFHRHVQMGWLDPNWPGSSILFPTVLYNAVLGWTLAFTAWVLRCAPITVERYFGNRTLARCAYPWSNRAGADHG